MLEMSGVRMEREQMTTKAPDLLPCDICGCLVTVDAVVANDVWARISPTHDEGGYLCPTCVAQRLADIEGWPAVYLSDTRAAVVAERDALREALVEANDLLRSTMQIASMAIQHEEFRVLANWDAFHDRLAVHLKRRHQVTNEARAALAKRESKE